MGVFAECEKCPQFGIIGLLFRTAPDSEESARSKKECCGNENGLVFLPVERALHRREKCTDFKLSVPTVLLYSRHQVIDPDITANLAPVSMDLVGWLQLVFSGQRRHLQAEAAGTQRIIGVILAPQLVQLIQTLGADVVVRLESNIAFGFEKLRYIVSLAHAFLYVLPGAVTDGEFVVIGDQAFQPFQRPKKYPLDLSAQLLRQKWIIYTVCGAVLHRQNDLAAEESDTAII